MRKVMVSGMEKSLSRGSGERDHSGTLGQWLGGVLCMTTGLWHSWFQISVPDKLRSHKGTHKSVKETRDIFLSPSCDLPPFPGSYSTMVLPSCWFSAKVVPGQCFLQFCFFFPVLPKFEVIFEAPSQIYALDKTFPLRVCGRWGLCLEGCPYVVFWPDGHKMVKSPWGALGKFTTLQLQEARIFHGSSLRSVAHKTFL